jgi:hypothetical protein
MHRRSGVYGGNGETVVFSEVYEVSISVSFAYEHQISQPPTVIEGRVVTERLIPLLLSGELDNGHYNPPFSVEENID